MLEIEERRRKILYLISKYPILIINSDIYCPINTKLPHLLLEAGYAADGKIIAACHSKRFTAVSAAKRLASNLNDPQLGHSVGFHAEYEHNFSKTNTKVIFFTALAFLIDIQYDPLLTKYSIVILNDVDERSLYMDLLCALIKLILRKRPELRIILTAASMNCKLFSDYFGQQSFSYQIAPESHPVKIFHTVKMPNNYLQYTLSTIIDVHKNSDYGDVLVFLPGTDEINYIFGRMGKLYPELKLRLCTLA